MRLLSLLGDHLVRIVRRWCHLAGVVLAVVRLCPLPSTWPRTVRAALARQILFSGIEATRFTALAAIFVGIAVVVQAQLWLYKIGQTAVLAPLLVTVVVREVGPLLANMIAISRTGNALTVEMATMKATGEVRVLDAQGLDPLVYLVIPRVVGLTVAVLCLTVVMIVVSLAGGFAFGVLVGARTGTPLAFARNIVAAIGPVDAVSVIVKATVPSLLAGTICCTEGLGVGGAMTDIPPAVTRAVQRSLVALFVVSIGISVFTYG